MKGVKFILGIDGDKSEVQSVLLDRSRFTTVTKAKSWLKKHGFKFDMIEQTDNFFRARQTDPSKYSRFATIDAGPRKNPETAEQMVEEFHGRPPVGETVVQETINVPKLADLGKLVSMVIGFDDEDIEVDFYGENLRLASNAKGTQLYIVGEKVDLSELVEPDRDIVEVGDLVSVTYETDKHHIDPDSPVGMYEHKFGEEGGDLPILLWNCVTGELLIVGGDYVVKPEGIVN